MVSLLGKIEERILNNYKFNQIELRPEYQQPIQDVTLSHLRESNDPAFVSASVGSGKTVNIGAVAAHVASIGGRVLVIARTGELVDQNSKMAWKMGVKNSVYSASLNTKSTFYPVVFASEGTLCRSLGTQFKDTPFNVILIDECLTGDTLISTSNGDFRIDDPRLINQKIYCIDESSGEIKLDYPTRVFSNGTRNVSHVRTLNGEVKCTSNHKIYTEDSWVAAGELQVGQKIRLRDLQSGFIMRLLRASVAVVKKLSSLVVLRALKA